MIKKLSLLVVFIILFSTLSCSEYQKAIKSEDVKVKYELAEKLYEEGKYKKAIRLFEGIATQYAGKPQGERIYYFLANSYYKTKDYYLAAYQFERFSKSYPKSDKVEEALFLNSKSQFYLSPKYSIDQTETEIAIEKLQLFINKYSESEYLEEANEMALQLKTKLERKDFEIAKQYNTIRDYKSAIRAFDLFLSKHPGSVFREDALYGNFIALYNLAIFSVYSKQEKRLNDAKEAYNTLLRFYADTKYSKDIESKLSNINNELEKFSKQT